VALATSLPKHEPGRVDLWATKLGALQELRRSGRRAREAECGAARNRGAHNHVCNNDAALQKALFDAYVSGGPATCDAMVDTCRGPMWLYFAVKIAQGPNDTFIV
jgi:hypothetical protein